MISFRADQRCRVQRVNNNKKVCKEACCGRETIRNNLGGAGKCGVKCLMLMSGVLVCVLTFCVVLNSFLISLKKDILVNILLNLSVTKLKVFPG